MSDPIYKALVDILAALVWQGDGNPVHGTATHSALLPADCAHRLVTAASEALQADSDKRFKRHVKRFGP